MTSWLSITFISISSVIIFNLPTSHGLNQGYHVSTINQILSPSERFTYWLTGSLPSRIYYSYSKHCYVVRRRGGLYKNNLRRKIGKRYKTVPRWRYYLDKLSPVGLAKSGLEYASIARPLLGLGGGFRLFGNDGDKDDDGEGDDNDAEGDGGTGGGKADDADDGKNNESGPGLLSKGMNLLSPYMNYFGGAKNENNNNNDEKQDDGKDDKKDDKKKEEPAAEGLDYTEMAKDVIQSEAAQDAAKLAVSTLVPGGPAIVALWEAGSKLASAEEKVDKVVPGNLPKLK